MPWIQRDSEGGARLSRTFYFKDYAQVLAFVARVGKLAETYKHHPRMIVTHLAVTVEWWTHDTGSVEPADHFMSRLTDDLWWGAVSRKVKCNC